ncbi:carbohydrate ABC transporter permease [Phytohabitans flavus]|uniref:carbohydrate ABC transporter permease n=1 Tax=Phytohabitans flavus TaxID=1076124 RepID=UPI003629C515
MVNAIILTGVVVVTLYPFLNIVARSLSDQASIISGEVNLLPKGFNLTSYEHVMSDPMFWRNYRNTVYYTFVATCVALILTTTYAYVLSKKHLKGRTFLVAVAVFTMFFNGGLIPNYVLVTSLGLKNSVWAIALPNAISVFNLLVMKAFFESLPVELEEAGPSTASARTGFCSGSCCRCPKRSSRRWCFSMRSPSGTPGSPRSSTWTNRSSSRSPST